MENMMGDTMENRELEQQWKDETSERKTRSLNFSRIILKAEECKGKGKVKK